MHLTGADHERPDHRSPGCQHLRGAAHPTHPRRAGREPAQVVVDRGEGGQRGAVGAVGEQVGGRPGEFADGIGEPAAQGQCLGVGAGRGALRQPRDGQPGHDRAGEQHDGGAGGEPGDHRGGDQQHRRGGGERDPHPHDQVLDRLHVGDHPGEQVAAAASEQGGAGQPAVGLQPQRRLQPQRHVVPHQPLGVAEGAPRDAEEPDGDRRRLQVEDGRVLGRTGEQPRRDSHQGHGGPGRREREQDGDDQAAAGVRNRGEEAPQECGLAGGRSTRVNGIDGTLVRIPGFATLRQAQGSWGVDGGSLDEGRVSGPRNSRSLDWATLRQAQGSFGQAQVRFGQGFVGTDPDDPVGLGQHGRAVAHHQRGDVQPAQALQQPGLGVGVEARGGLVQHEQRDAAAAYPQQRPGDRDPAPLAGRDALGVVPDGLGRGQRTGARQREGLGDLVRAGSRGAERDVVGDRAGDQAGRLPDPRHPASPGRGVGDRCAVGEHPAAGGDEEAHHGVQQRGLAAPAGAGQRDHLAGADVEGHRGQRGSRRPGIAVGEVAHRQHRHRPGGLVEPGFRRTGGVRPGRLRDGDCFSGPRSVDHGEGLLDGRQPVGGVVVVHADLAHRQVRLGGQDQDEQGGGEVELPEDDPEADRDGDDRHRQGRQQFEHQRGEERHPQRAHGLGAVLGLAALQPFGLGFRPSEHLQGRQAGDQVGEVVGEPGLHRPPLARDGLGRPAHQGHEERDQRQSEGHDHRREQVGAQNRKPDHERHGDGQQQLRQVLGEVAVQSVQALRHQRDQAAAGGLLQWPGEPGGHDVAAQLRLDRGGRPLREPLVRPGQQGLAAEHRGQAGDGPAEGVQPAGGEHVRHRTRQQPCLTKGQDGCRAAHRDPGDQVTPGRAGSSQQAGIDRARHQLASTGSSSGMLSTLRRRRNTQYVQAW